MMIKPDDRKGNIANHLRRGLDGFAVIGLSLGVLALWIWIAACSVPMPWPGNHDDPAAYLLLDHAQAAGPTMRVRIAQEVAQVRLGGADQVALATPAGSGLVLRTPVVLERAYDAWRATDAQGQAHELIAARDDTLRAIGVDRTLTVDGVAYRGQLRFHPRDEVSQGVFDIVEHVAMEAYLPGVLARELPAGWRPETYRAQAIAARSYALHEHNRRMAAGKAFDVEADTRDQAYAGAAAYPAAVDAVHDTAGMVLLHRGQVLRAYYSSTSGGRQARARDTWPTAAEWAFNLAAPINTPQLTPESALSPLHRWEIRRDRGKLLERIRSYAAQQGMAARKLPGLKAIEVSKANQLGRPVTYKLIAPDGRSWTMPAEHLRRACNFGAPQLQQAERVHSGDAEFAMQQATIIIKGRGFGHGVGMCQWGAEALARQGRSAAEILAHYYPGAAIGIAYAAPAP